MNKNLSKFLQVALMSMLFVCSFKVSATEKSIYVVLSGHPVYNEEMMYQPTTDNAEKLADYRLKETTAGSNVYEGYISFEGWHYFRIFTQLIAPSDSFYAPYELGSSLGNPDDYYSFAYFPKADCGITTLPYVTADNIWLNGFLLPDECRNRRPYITVDMNNKTVTVDCMNRVYLVGDISGNVEPTKENAEYYKDYVLPYGDVKIFDIPKDKMGFYLCPRLSSGEKIGVADCVSKIDLDEEGWVKISLEDRGVHPFDFNDQQGGKTAFYYDENTLEVVKFDSKIYLTSIVDKNYNCPRATRANAEYFADWVLTETEPGSLIYKGTFEISGDVTSTQVFRFLDRLYIDDSSYNISKINSMNYYYDVFNYRRPIQAMIFDENGFIEREFMFGNGYAGLGASLPFTLQNWKTGTVEITVNINDRTVQMQADSYNASKYLVVMGGAEIAREPVPANIYDYSDWMLWETKTPGIYQGRVFNFENDFNVYISTFSSDEGMNAVAYCPGTEDKELELGRNGIVTMNMEKSTCANAGAWTLTGFYEHRLTENYDGVLITVNTNDNTIQFNIPSMSECIYLVGTHSGWLEPTAVNADIYADWAMYKAEGSNDEVYEGIFEIPAYNWIFRIYKSLTGWDGGNSYGIQYADSPIDVSFTEGVFNGSFVYGKGCWSFPSWIGGKVKVTADFTTNNITIDTNVTGIDDVEADKVSVVPGVGCVTVAGVENVVIYNPMGVLVKQLNSVEEIVTIELPAGLYLVNGQKVKVK